MNKKVKPALLLMAGILMLVGGQLLLKLAPGSAAVAIPYALIGLGAVAIGQGASDLINLRRRSKDSALNRRLEIECNDERNLTLTWRAKAKAYDAMVFVLTGLMFTYAIMGVELAPLLMLVAAYLFIVNYMYYYHDQLAKEM